LTRGGKGTDPVPVGKPLGWKKRGTGCSLAEKVRRAHERKKRRGTKISRRTYKNTKKRMKQKKYSPLPGTGQGTEEERGEAGGKKIINILYPHKKEGTRDLKTSRQYCPKESGEGFATKKKERDS